MIEDEDHRKEETDVDLQIVATADVVRQTDGTVPSGTIDLPLVTDQVGGTVPETGTEGIEIEDLELGIVDRDRKIKGHRWIVREMENDLPIAQEMLRRR